MSAATPTPANPFGLTNSLMLQQLRQQEFSKTLDTARATQSGRNFGATAAGLALGRGLRGILVDHGLIEDPEADTAKQVTQAQNRARISTEGRPEEMKNANDPYDQIQAYGLNLISELTVAGLPDQADLVRQKMLADEKQRLELRKLSGDVTAQNDTHVGKEIENRVDAATAEADILKRRADSLSATVGANVAIGTQGWQIGMRRQEYDSAVQKFQHDKVMNPFLERSAQDDAKINDLQASLGGPVPELVKLQAQRDHVVVGIANMKPGSDKRYALQTLQEINEKIQTVSLGVQRQVSNWSPTTAVRSELQNSLVEAHNFSSQAQGMIDLMAKLPSDAFGLDADARVAGAGLVNKVMTYAGAPSSTANDMSALFASDDTLEVRAKGRQLKADVVSWLSSGSHASTTDVETAKDLLQVFDEPLVTTRSANIALMNFIKWVNNKQETQLKVLETSVQALAPKPTSLEEQFGSYMTTGTLNAPTTGTP